MGISIDLDIFLVRFWPSGAYPSMCPLGDAAMDSTTAK
jgi:hypothetical protein